MPQDLRFAFRSLARSPLTALLAMGALCVGTAVTVAIFTVTLGVLLRGLPYPDGGELALVWRGTTLDPAERGALSPPDYLDVRDGMNTLTTVAAVNSFSTTYLPETGDPQQLQLGVVAGDFFGVMRVPPLLGRTLVPADDRPTNTRDSTVITPLVLNHGFWSQALGASPDVVGRTLGFGGSRMMVVGVMPPAFRLHMPAGAGMSTDLIGWTPLGIDYANAPRDGAYLKIIARLAPGATLEAAQSELDGLAAR